MHASEAPFLLVGTHKDELEDEPAALAQAQKILTNFLYDLPLDGPLANIRKRIQRPSKEKLFFAVDNKSRENTAEGKERASDLSVNKIRSTLERVVNNDKREVEGLCVYTFQRLMCTA